MADLIRKVTIQKGHDPRDFVIFAFGGAGPTHAGVFAQELGVSKVIVPQRETASVWCAFGAAAADLLHVHERVNIMRSPFDDGTINAMLAELKARGAADLAADDVAPADRQYRFTLDMRHKGQINEVEVDLEGEAVAADQVDALHEEFRRRYEALYGRGAALPNAQLEVVTFRCRASGVTRKPRLTVADALQPEPCARGSPSVPLGLLGGVETPRRNAHLRRRPPRTRQPDRGAGGDRHRGHHGGGPSGADVGRRRVW